MNVYEIPSEIWLQIGTQITQERKLTLRSLSETCHFLNKIFTPLLFSSLRFTSFEEIVSEDFSDLPLVSSLRFVKNFKVIAGAGYAESRTPPEEAGLYKKFNRNLVKCVRAMPNLVSFTLGQPGSWKSFKEEEDGLNSVPIFDNLMRALQQSSPKLRDLTLCISDMPSLENEFDEWLRFNGAITMQSFVAFRSLTSLRLVGEWVRNASTNAIVSTLLYSPALSYFSVDGWSPSLPDICAQYAQAGGQQLGLKHLRYSAYHNKRFNTDSLPQWEKLTDLRKLESIELEIWRLRNDNGEYSAAREGVYLRLADPAQFSSLRRLSVDRLDDALFTVVQGVGQNLELPPFFLSELFFETFDCDGAIRGGFDIHPQKREYWPTCFVLGQNIGWRSKTAFRQRLVKEVSEWKALRLLHLPLHMKTDKAHLVNLCDLLNTSLRELYVTDHQDTDDEDSIEDDDPHGSDIDLAKRLCANSRLSYVAVYDCFFRVVRQLGEEVRLEYCDIFTSEAEEAEIFMLYREGMRI
ncbi:hypothetical protein BJY01DRAFT_175663 [Aspergillus pseudoustus]|uniref:F-box domain-containing protein n=1 Tax=Aspergillus pseudoustus TaxID=1810923 RepID=A0ABR4K2C7_9EURO